MIAGLEQPSRRPARTDHINTHLHGQNTDKPAFPTGEDNTPISELKTIYCDSATRLELPQKQQAENVTRRNGEMQLLRVRRSECPRAKGRDRGFAIGTEFYGLGEFRMKVSWERQARANIPDLRVVRHV